MRQTRYEVEMVEHHKTIQQLVCDECGALEDIVALSRPEGWTTLYQNLEHGSESKDFCSWACLYSYVMFTSNSGPEVAEFDKQGLAS